jgi:hypothetical protein
MSLITQIPISILRWLATGVVLAIAFLPYALLAICLFCFLGLLWIPVLILSWDGFDRSAAAWIVGLAEGLILAHWGDRLLKLVDPFLDFWVRMSDKVVKVTEKFDRRPL